MSVPAAFESVESVQRAFAGETYIADRPLALTVMLAAQLGKPILLEGEAGVGKTDVAKVLARVLDTELIRLQCYEGLDANSTIYEWNYSKQILRIRMAEQFHEKVEALDKTIFSDEFLLSRPLLRAVRHPGPRPVVLLIDEVDRADEEFEAFLLEVLSDFQVTVPEIGTFTAQVPPVAVLTSNRTRELNDALKRRCLYLWIDYPTPAKEREIVMRKVPGIETRLAELTDMLSNPALLQSIVTTMDDLDIDRRHAWPDHRRLPCARPRPRRDARRVPLGPPHEPRQQSRRGDALRSSLRDVLGRRVGNRGGRTGARA